VFQENEKLRTAALDAFRIIDALVDRPVADNITVLDTLLAQWSGSRVAVLRN
jgi:hypothetical protein